MLPNGAENRVPVASTTNVTHKKRVSKTLPALALATPTIVVPTLKTPTTHVPLLVNEDLISSVRQDSDVSQTQIAHHSRLLRETYFLAD